MTKPTKLCATGCGRTAYVGDYCKTHHVKGPEYQIRTYSPRGEGRVEYAGIPVLTRTRDALERAEKRAEMAARTLVGAILDAWAAGRVWGPMLARAGLGALVAVVFVGGAAGLRCAGSAAHMTLTKEMPRQPIPGQALPPCEEPAELRNGGCWVPVIRRNGEVKTDCLKSETYFTDPKDPQKLCWYPAMKKIRNPSPSMTPGLEP